MAKRLAKLDKVMSHAMQFAPPPSPTKMDSHSDEQF